MAMVFGACGGSKLGGGMGGSGGFATGGDGWGGTTGVGGFGGTGTGGFGEGGDFGGAGGGWVPTGGSFGNGGYYGTGGSTGFGGSPFPDGGTCSAPIQGPLSTWDSSRPFGWTFTGPTSTGTAGASGETAGDGGVALARCQTVPAAYPGTSCVGLASLEMGARGPVILFADGSQLAWDRTLPPAVMPYVAQTDGGHESVWVDFEKKTTVVCPFCGAYTTYKLQLRNGAAGKLRFYDQQGDVLPNLTDAQVMDIFGAPATATPSCTFPAYAGCNSFLRSEFDHQLATNPSQTILDATPTQVTAPNGKFEVIWASSSESYVETMQGCGEDGPGVATDTGFVAALVAP
jgi:hypothetical protein